MIFRSPLLAIAALLASVFSATAVVIIEDETPEPGGVYGGSYVPWGIPPFVEHDEPPEPGGAFEGKPFATTDLVRTIA